jgi:UDP-N-acetylmuramoyl-tripeptide--D-alanyl-D-alanine ligase
VGWMTLDEVAREIGAQARGILAGEVVGVTTDTRDDVRGRVFFALRGENHDGHDYVARALEHGAATAVVDHAPPGVADPLLIVPDTLGAYGDLARAHRLRFGIPVVGVTGSVGKTSTREMIAAALEARFEVLSTQRNYNNDVGVPRTLFGLTADHGVAVIEMAMRARGEIARLAQIARPTVGVITNIGLSHIEILGSRDEIAAAKAELLEALPPYGRAIIPADDAYADFLRERAPCEVITFGLSERAGFRATGLVFDEHGAPRFRVNGQPIEIASPGVHHVANAAAACAIADVLGIEHERVAERLAAYRPQPGRMRPVTTAAGVTVLDDSYNAAPDSMRAGLETLALIARARGGRAVAFLGDMKELGDHSAEAHRYVGEVAGTLGIDLIVTVGDAAEDTGRAAAERIGADNIRAFAYSEEAARIAPSLVIPGDVTLVKGSRAMQMERIVEALIRG